MLFTFMLQISYEKFANIFTSFFIWNLLHIWFHISYKVKEITPKLMDLKNRLVAIVHGLLSQFLSLYCVFFSNISFEDKNNWLVNLILLNSLGYFIYDLFIMLYYNLWNKSYIIHHFMSITGILIGYFSNLGGLIISFGLFIAEISNWSMNIRMILKMYGLRYTKIYETLEIIYIFLYFVGRIIFGPYLFFLTIKIKNVPWPISFLILGIFLQSFNFSIKMISILKNKIYQKKERNKNKLHYWWFSVNPKILNLKYTQKIDKQKIF